MWENNVCVGAVGAPALYLLADKDARPNSTIVRPLGCASSPERNNISEFILYNEETTIHCDCSLLFLASLENEYCTCNLAVFPRKASREVAQSAKTRGNRLCQHQLHFGAAYRTLVALPPLEKGHPGCIHAIMFLLWSGAADADAGGGE